MVSFENTQIAFKSKDDKALKKMHWLFRMMSREKLVVIGTSILNLSLKIKLPVEGIIRKTLFNHFCGGESIEDCMGTIKDLDSFNIKTILDYSVEGKDDEKDFDRNKDEIKATIKRASEDDSIPFSVFKVSGIARNMVLNKVNDGVQLTESEKAEYERVKSRVDDICSYGHQHKVPVLIDAEESWIQQPIDDMAHDMMRKYNKELCIIFNTAQMYRTDRLLYINDLIKMARQEEFFVGLKLVRGAYMEKERERAKEKGYPSPIQPDKNSTDNDFDAAVAYCMENRDVVSTCCGSHNEKSNLLVVELMKEFGLSADDKHVYFAQLLGMSDHISYNLSSAGYNVAKYVPYGPIRDVIPYLIRRAEENTSIAGQTGRELRLIDKEVARRKSEN